MQITLDKNEVQAIVLEHLNKLFTGAEFNRIHWNSTYSNDFCQVMREEKEEEQ